ncbi:hypothetical protein Tco_0650444 [Tanacetum coccineum]
MAPLEYPHVVSSVKLPILKKGEYTLWSMRMEKYLTNTDYALWQVIMNGDEPVQTTKDENGVETEVPPKTAQALLQIQRERKAKSILLLAIPDEYQLRFHGIKDANLCGLLSRVEGLDKAYDRFQKLISLLEVHSAAVSNEDANQKFLRALASSWNNVALIMRNKTEDPNSINEVNTANGVSTASCHNYQGQASSSSYTDDLMFSFFANQSNSPQLDDEDLEGHFARECRASRNQGNRNGDAGYRIRDITKRTILVETSDALVVQDNALIMQDGLGYDWSLESVEAQLVVHQKNEADYEEKIAILEFEVKDKGNAVTRLTNQLEQTLKEKEDLKAKLEQVSKGKVNTVIINGVNTAGQTGVSTIKGNGALLLRPQQGNPQQALKYKGMFDSGCSRHMTGNKALLTDYHDIYGGFVAIGGTTRGGKISGIGKIRTNKIDFEDVFFVKELKFNLFSVSQMCDKKNNVLFTKIECLVLSTDFKLIDESQVLLRVLRQNNMYSFDLKNVVPSRDLTYLFAKAIIDESKL